MAGIALIATAAATAAPRLAGGGAVDVSIVRILAALVLSLAIGGVAILLLRRGNGRFELLGRKAIPRMISGRRITPLETRRISAHADICLFRCDDVEYLVLSSATRQHVLRQAPASVEPTS